MNGIMAFLSAALPWIVMGVVLAVFFVREAKRKKGKKGQKFFHSNSFEKSNMSFFFASSFKRSLKKWLRVLTPLTYRKSKVMHHMIHHFRFYSFLGVNLEVPR
jgi:hypothetical protein